MRAGQDERGGRSRPWWSLSALGLAIGVVGCAPAEREAVAEEGDGGGARVINVEAAPIVLGGFVDYIRVTGEVEALHDVTVSAEEAGPIEEFYVEKGRRVQQGAPIAKIDDAVLAAQVEEARAAAQLAQEQYERQRRLWEDEGIGSEIVYLQTKSGWEVAAARLATLRARLERTVIRAPVTGVFDDKLVEVGEMVAPGTAVVRVVAVDRVKIVGGVPERYAGALRSGASARVTLDVLPGRELAGRISFVGATVDPSSRTVPIEIVLPNPDRSVKPKMVANVQIVRERLDGVVVVPQEVVLRTEAGYQVFVVEPEEGRPMARARAVELGAAYGNRVVVLRGLEVGERIVTLGHRLVDDGSRVRVVNEEGAIDD